MTDFLFHHGTRETLKRHADEGYAVVVPLAATEQHGPNLPVFTDSLIGEHLAFEACKQAATSTKLLLAPTLVVGCSQHHLAFGGTLSFTSSTYLLMLKEIGESLVSGGFRKIIFLNAHGGNEPMMHQAAQDLAVQHDIWTASASYWSLSRSALTELHAQEMGMVPGHAGGFETSLIASLTPDLIRNESIDRPAHSQRSWINAGPPGSFVGKHSYLTGVDGYTDSAHQADAAKGAMYMQAIIESTAQWLVQVGNWMNEGVELAP
ncbi:creatininase family protein [Paenibacillus sp. 5J-6]|uniref:Creatininase family protein n=1 Tax=Paenibacillus silvestris TaxID=2606219 RepID=A0A6L8UTC8_9BACL|nr:creatininase family protein [Paenibacillus silvestris]MZQ81388.1 creatininase family protein [Paenibacillus silvestris]